MPAWVATRRDSARRTLAGCASSPTIATCILAVIPRTCGAGVNPRLTSMTGRRGGRDELSRFADHGQFGGDAAQDFRQRERGVPLRPRDLPAGHGPCALN